MLPRRNRRHRREIAARHHEHLDLRPIDPRERVARVLRAELSDRVRVGRAESLERDRLEPVLVLEIASGARVHGFRIGRHDSNATRLERPHGAAHRLRRRDRGNAGGGTHPLRDDVVVVVGNETRRRLSQDHQLDFRRPQQPRLIVDVLIPARREATAAREEAPDVRLVRRRQEPALDLDRRVRGWNQHAEMSCHALRVPHCPRHVDLLGKARQSWTFETSTRTGVRPTT